MQDITHATRVARHHSSGFTLVELIVVITVLAILGTIGFISFQGYTADARNAKRNQDMASIVTVIANARAKSALPLSTYYTTATNSRVIAANRSVGGYKSTTLDPSTALYDAGTVNYSALQIASRDFSDPTTSLPYIMGWTTLDGASYEIAGTIEGSVPMGEVKGSYIPRTSYNGSAALATAFPIGLTDSGVAVTVGSTLYASGSATSIPAGSNFTATFPSNIGVQGLRVGDLIAGNNAGGTLTNGVNAVTVTKVSPDMKTVIFTNISAGTITPSVPTIGSNWAVASEQMGLITNQSSVSATACNSGAIPVTDGGACLPY